ncbi:MAG: hypothetical protein PHF86_08860 [Candidatus Nanoarchaeia archaeon]|nr:hypothetical protein [Candidatus Nanoarchaeia archaeon]
MENTLLKLMCDYFSWYIKFFGALGIPTLALGVLVVLFFKIKDYCI